MILFTCMQTCHTWFHFVVRIGVSLSNMYLGVGSNSDTIQTEFEQNQLKERTPHLAQINVPVRMAHLQNMAANNGKESIQTSYNSPSRGSGSMLTPLKNGVTPEGEQFRAECLISPICYLTISVRRGCLSEQRLVAIGGCRNHIIASYSQLSMRGTQGFISS